MSLEKSKYPILGGKWRMPLVSFTLYLKAMMLLKGMFVLVMFCALWGQAPAREGIRSIPLGGDDWSLEYWAQPYEPIRTPAGIPASAKKIPAQVPGNVELDLLRAGLIEDPMVGDNNYKLRWTEGMQWMYSRKFSVPKLDDGQRVVLRLEGVDTLADVYVNGRLAGSPENMFIAHSFDVTELVREGEGNVLEIIIRSSVLELKNYQVGALSMAYEFEPLRKAPHMFGWDIMPRIVSAGLWRMVWLDIENPVKIRDVNFILRSVEEGGQSNGRGVYQINAPAEKLGKIDYRLRISLNGKQIAERSWKVERLLGDFGFTVDDSRLWWPRGYGAHPLYDFEFSIVEEDGTVLDTVRKKIGLRSVQLEYADVNLPDEKGAFQFIINGEKIFVKGSNWVPVSALHSQDAGLLESVLKMAVDLNCNMLRCWGGNVYEDSAYYEFCDANGIMVWQDFSMACGMPPQSDEFARRIAEEVRSVVVKLRNHASIVLWAGNNENDIQPGWLYSKAYFRVDPNRDRVSRRVIPEVLFEFDPTRPYLPSSPYMSPRAFAREAQPSEAHLWGPRGYFKAPFYTQSKARFVSEIGYHGCPNKESLEKMMESDCVYPWTDFENLKWNRQWQAKAVMPFLSSVNYARRNNLMTNQVKALFGEVPEDLNEFIMASQIVQAEAKKYFIEFWRGQKFDKSGIIWWNLRDGWPIISDAIVDYYNSKKLAYSYIKRVQANVLVLMNDALEVIAVNDTLNPTRGSVKITNIENSRILLETSFEVERNGKTLIGKLPDIAGDAQGIYLIEYEVGGVKMNNHYLYGKPPFKQKEYVRLMQKVGFFDF